MVNKSLLYDQLTQSRAMRYQLIFLMLVLSTLYHTHAFLIGGQSVMLANTCIKWRMRERERGEGDTDITYSLHDVAHEHMGLLSNWSAARIKGNQ